LSCRVALAAKGTAVLLCCIPSRYVTPPKRRKPRQPRQTKLQYEQTTLNPFPDVSNALISRLKYEAIRKEQARSVAAYQEA